jgi:hypothetical protein
MEKQPRILQETALLTGRALRLGKLAFERVFTGGGWSHLPADPNKRVAASIQYHQTGPTLLQEQDLPGLRQAHERP